MIEILIKLLKILFLDLHLAQRALLLLLQPLLNARGVKQVQFVARHRGHPVVAVGLAGTALKGLEAYGTFDGAIAEHLRVILFSYYAFEEFCAPVLVFHGLLSIV